MSALSTTTLDIIGDASQLEATLARADSMVRSDAAVMAKQLTIPVTILPPVMPAMPRVNPIEIDMLKKAGVDPAYLAQLARTSGVKAPPPIDTGTGAYELANAPIDINHDQIAQMNAAAEANRAKIAGDAQARAASQRAKLLSTDVDPTITNGRRVLEALAQEKTGVGAALAKKETDEIEKGNAALGRKRGELDKISNKILNHGVVFGSILASINMAAASTQLWKAKQAELNGEIEGAHAGYLRTVEAIKSTPFVGGIIGNVVNLFNGAEDEIAAVGNATRAMNDRLQISVETAKRFRDTMRDVGLQTRAANNRIELGIARTQDRPGIEARQRFENEQADLKRQGEGRVKALEENQKQVRDRVKAEADARTDAKLAMGVDVTDADYEKAKKELAKNQKSGAPDIFNSLSLAAMTDQIARERIRSAGNAARDLAVKGLTVGQNKERDELTREVQHDQARAGIAGQIDRFNVFRDQAANLPRRAFERAGELNQERLSRQSRQASAAGDEQGAINTDAEAKKRAVETRIKGETPGVFGFAFPDASQLRRIAAEQATIDAETKAKIEALNAQHQVRMDEIDQSAGQRRLRLAGNTNEAELQAERDRVANLVKVAKNGTKDAQDEAEKALQDLPKAEADIKARQKKDRDRSAEDINSSAAATELQTRGFRLQADTLRENARYARERRDALEQTGGSVDEKVRAIDAEHAAQLRAIQLSGPGSQSFDITGFGRSGDRAAITPNAITPEVLAAQATAESTRKMAEAMGDKGLKLHPISITEIATALLTALGLHR